MKILKPWLARYSVWPKLHFNSREKGTSFFFSRKLLCWLLVLLALIQEQAKYRSGCSLSLWGHLPYLPLYPEPGVFIQASCGSVWQLIIPSGTLLLMPATWIYANYYSLRPLLCCMLRFFCIWSDSGIPVSSSPGMFSMVLFCRERNSQNNITIFYVYLCSEITAA